MKRPNFPAEKFGRSIKIALWPMSASAVAYIVGYPLADLTRAVVLTALDLNLRRAHPGSQRGIDSIADQSALGRQAEVLEQHRC